MRRRGPQSERVPSAWQTLWMGEIAMKLYVDAGRAPNPRRVRIFLAEKGVTLPIEAVDLGAQAHKAPAYRAINPMQRLPALAIDDGTVIAESIAICRYIEAQ